MSTKKILMAKIHIGKKELVLDDDTYRDLLWRVTGKRSCKDMNLEQLKDVLKVMEDSGFKPKAAKKYGKKPKVIRRRQALMGKIEAMLADMELSWNYAHGIGENMFEIKRLEWLSDNQLYKVTQALSVHQRRKQ